MNDKLNDGMNAKQRYNAKLKKLTIELNTDIDQDIINYLETVGSKQGYIKALIRNDISKQCK